MSLPLLDWGQLAVAPGRRLHGVSFSRESPIWGPGSLGVKAYEQLKKAWLGGSEAQSLDQWSLVVS